MSKQETTKRVISKWKIKNYYGGRLQQVVYLHPIGKNKKGKQIFKSITKHEPI